MTMNGCAQNTLMKVCPPMPSGVSWAGIQRTYFASCATLESRHEAGQKPCKQMRGGNLARNHARDGGTLTPQSEPCAMLPSEGRDCAANPTRCLGSSVRNLRTGRAERRQNARSSTARRNGRHSSNTFSAVTPTPANDAAMDTIEATRFTLTTSSRGRQTRL